MSYRVEDYTVVFENGQRHNFPDLITQVVELEGVLVLRLGADSLRRTNQNVFAFDYRGNLLWQIPVRHHFNEHSPYVDLFRSGEMIDACNWDGQVLTLHPKSGDVISEGSIATAYTPSRRQRTPKSYM